LESYCSELRRRKVPVLWSGQVVAALSVSPKEFLEKGNYSAGHVINLFTTEHTEYTEEAFKIDGFVRIRKRPSSSFPWKRESSFFELFLGSWIPAFAGMTIYSKLVRFFRVVSVFRGQNIFQCFVSILTLGT
jgi:hypothetical protein